MQTGLTCTRCYEPMEEGKLLIEQQPFPVQWVKVIAGLNDGSGNAVFGWGRAAAESRKRRAALDASRRTISAWRCAKCGKVELAAS